MKDYLINISFLIKDDLININFCHFVLYYFIEFYEIN